MPAFYYTTKIRYDKAILQYYLFMDSADKDPRMQLSGSSFHGSSVVLGSFIFVRDSLDVRYGKYPEYRE